MAAIRYDRHSCGSVVKAGQLKTFEYLGGYCPRKSGHVTYYHGKSKWGKHFRKMEFLKNFITRMCFGWYCQRTYFFAGGHLCKQFVLQPLPILYFINTVLDSWYWTGYMPEPRANLNLQNGTTSHFVVDPPSTRVPFLTRFSGRTTISSGDLCPLKPWDQMMAFMKDMHFVIRVFGLVTHEGYMAL